jgi:hypothetical protein
LLELSYARGEVAADGHQQRDVIGAGSQVLANAWTTAVASIASAATQNPTTNSLSGPSDFPACAVNSVPTRPQPFGGGLSQTR